MNNLYQEYQSKNKEDVILSYHGEITYDMVKSMLEMLMNTLENVTGTPKVKKKVVYVMVEMLENLVKHVTNLDDRDVNNNDVVVTVWSEKESYYIATGNYVSKAEKEYLSEWISKINSFSREELRSFFKQKLSESEISSRGGAGLGFIDIARKSKQKLEFKFDDAEDNQYFFTLRVSIIKE